MIKISEKHKKMYIKGTIYIKKTSQDIFSVGYNTHLPFHSYNNEKVMLSSQ